MSQSNESHEILKTFLGILLLLGCHVIAVIAIFALAYILESRFGGYSSLQVLIIGGVGFLFWQLLYVIPLCIWLGRRQQIAIRRGVIIGAVITALLNGGCFLLLNIH